MGETPPIFHISTEVKRSRSPAQAPVHASSIVRMRFPDWPPRGGWPPNLHAALRLHAKCMFTWNTRVDASELTYQAFKSQATFQEHMAATAAKYKAASGAVLTKYQRWVPWAWLFAWHTGGLLACTQPYTACVVQGAQQLPPPAPWS